jgi:ABC-type branched-subunit amino acid transport system substrate-binding protein
VTGSQITVEALITALDFGTSGAAAAKARFAQANATNEVPCGRKINYLGFADDGGTPDQNLSVVRRFVEQDHVFAIVPALSPFIQSSGVFINQQHVPTLGWGVAPAFCPTGNYSGVYAFGFNGCLVPSPVVYEAAIAGPTMAALFPGGAQGHTAAVIGDESTSTKAGVAGVAAQLEVAGFKVVYQQSPMPAPPTVPTDFSPYVQAVMTANGGKPPDALFIATGPITAFPLSKALRQAGFKGVIQHSTYAPQVVAAAATQYAGNTFATIEEKTPQMTQIINTLHAAGITTIGQPELAAYYSADMFIQILKKVGANLTPETFRQAAYNFTYEIPNTIGPTPYPEAFVAGVPCGESVYSNGATWSLSVPYKCFGYDITQQNGQWVKVPYPSGVKLP